MNKRGQITLFIIIAVVIIALAIFLLFFYPKMKIKKYEEPTNPHAYLQDCINNALEPLVEKLASQGGYLELGNCIFYKNICRHYLCYTTQPYVPCINQEPLLKENIETILRERLKQENVVSSCINRFIEYARKKGYDVSSCEAPKFFVNLTKGRVNVPIECKIVLKKGEEKKEFLEYNPYLTWPLFEFVLLSKQIIHEEITNADFDPVAFMLRNYWIEIEKFRASEGSIIYTLRDRKTRKEFVFAVRNYVLPPGVL
ncbi:MAG: hypothetical protein NZ889_01190 [Candidatus Pacearchaeota archaeon]|nr:hypothetical protein [Candidatus Pacearchaeota archaeon]